MILLHRRPGPPLSRYIEMLWYCESSQLGHRQERVIPSGRSQLIIDLSDGFSLPTATGVVHQAAAPPLVVGLQTRYTVLETAALRLIMGAVFRPGGARGLLGMPADEYRDQVIGLDAIWGSSASELRDRLRAAATIDGRFTILEAALQHRARLRPFTLHGAVQHAIEKFERAPHICSVLGVTRATGLSRRRFSELFREQVGLTPKLYCRVLRFQRVVQQIAQGGQVDWSDVALAGGYCDQSHLSNEFRDFSGISPSAYVAADRTHANHVVLD